MLHFLKKKQFLKDLIPSNFIDIHSHILPGIDDGAKTIEDTFFLVNELQKIGFEQSITTPHVMTSVWDNTKENITATLEKTIAHLTPKINFPMKAAAEYLIDANLVTLFQNESLLVLKDNYVLVEMSYINPPIQLYTILFELQVAGYQPVLAHPERYPFYHQNFSEYEKLKNSGCLFQLNLLSTMGYYGIAVTKTCEKLLQKGMIDFVGSDVHHENHISTFSKRTLLKDPLPLREAIDKNEFFRF
jgi:tyrosine-protein phosphatase YwqE